VIISRRKIRMAAGPLIKPGTPAAYSPVSSAQAAHTAALLKTIT
jgi:hypothetical protein